MSSIHDTICAIATPNGLGAQGTIKISGSNALSIVAQIFFPVKKKCIVAELPPYSATYGWIKDSILGEPIDDAMLLVMRSPHSYTGEDQVEITCHGSPLILSMVIQLLIQKGARLAEPGEFTRRAFMNGKMDLSQAESVADVIASTNQAALRLSLTQMKGLFRKKIENLREQLIHFASLIELELDFSEEDVEFVSRDELQEKCTQIINEVSDLANSFETSQVIKNGIPIAIVGSTNAGKSTLLNGLLQEEKAIVSDIHGTTRDIIEDTLYIEGQQFRIIDTAGIRKTDDQIESIGIEKALSRASNAEHILWMIDSTEGTNQLEELFQVLAPLSTKITPIINKIDIAKDDYIMAIQQVLQGWNFERILTISVNDSSGIMEIKQLLHHLFKHVTVANDQVMVTNIRQADALRKAKEALQNVSSSINHGLTGDLIAQDLRAAISALGEVTGSITTDDLLSSIFSHFCIGK